MSQWKIKGLDYQAYYYMMGQLWSAGTVWIRKNLVGDPVVCQYAGYEYNHYNFPTKVTLINTHNAPLTEIPNTPQVVDRDGCIIYLRPNRKGLESDVNYYIGKMAEAEACITVNLAIQRTPWIFAGDGISAEKLNSLMQKILGNDIAVFANCDKNDIQTVDLQRDYVIDRLTEYEERLENKVKTLLSVDNQGGYLNREQQNLDTTNSNNDEINDTGNAYTETLRDGFKRLKEATGLDIEIEETSKPVDQISKQKLNSNGGPENEI